MAAMNHARLAHRGRPTESAFVSGRQKQIMRFSPAKAASCGRSLGADELARAAAEMGFAVKPRAAANDR